MATTTFADLSADAVVFIRDELLDIAEKNTVFAQFAMMATLPQHNSKTIQFSRYPRLHLPDDPATEGVTPDDSESLALQTVQAVVDQWILIVTLSDLSTITVKHPLVPIVTELLGLAEAELVDREIQKTLMAGTSVTFANDKTSRAALVSTDTLNSVEVRKQYAGLKRRGARTMGKNYVMIVDPEVAQDVQNEDQFLSVHSLINVTAVYNNQIGDYLGFSFVVSNHIPAIELLPDADWSVDSPDASSGSSFTAGQIVFVKVEAISLESGLVEEVSNEESVTITNNGDTVEVTVPSDTSFRYNVYVSDTNNDGDDANLRLHTRGAAAGEVVSITAFATSGVNPQATPSTGVTVHTSYALGKDAYGMVKLSGDNLRVLMTKNEATDSDPAAQRRKMTLKGSFKSVILNNDWYRRIESSSAFDL